MRSSGPRVKRIYRRPTGACNGDTLVIEGRQTRVDITLRPGHGSIKMLTEGWRGRTNVDGLWIDRDDARAIRDYLAEKLEEEGK